MGMFEPDGWDYMPWPEIIAHGVAHMPDPIMQELITEWCRLNPIHWTQVDDVGEMWVTEVDHE